jgi:hypothetical protein
MEHGHTIVKAMFLPKRVLIAAWGKRLKKTARRSVGPRYPVVETWEAQRT